MIYSINYDLNKPGQNYDRLYEAIKSIGPWFHAMDSVWFVSSRSRADAIYEKLKPFIDSNDNLFIAEVTGNRQGWMSKEFWNWLRKVEQKAA